ncbi:MAG: TOBE domain-containing protein [Thermoplasmata archaeon]|nr:TOBE domain-containing protein [Thermoplasmata archaeon]
MPSPPNRRGRADRVRPWLTPVDRLLLESLTRSPSVAAACRRAGLTRDRGNYRLRRLASGFGGPVVHGRRGGRGVGGSQLTRLGRTLLARAREGTPATARPNRFTGTYRSGPPPRLELEGGPALVVAFRAPEGTRQAVRFDPETILLARRRFESSARNVLEARVVHVRGRGTERVELTLGVGGQRLRAAITPAAVERLEVRSGRRLWIYLKATALHREAAGPR